MLLQKRSHKDVLLHILLHCCFSDQYRSVINFTSLRYNAVLNNTFSAEYVYHSRNIAAEVENVFQQLHGEQTATVVQFRF